MAERQGAPAADFAAVMMSESGMNARAKNASGYRGLIQMSKENLQDQGMSNAQIDNYTNLSPAQQMPSIERYYRGWRPPSGWASRAQIYEATYLPALIRLKGSDPNTILTRKGDGTGWYEGNQIFDRAKKNYITVGDLERRIQIATEDENPQGWADALTGIQGAGENPFQTASFHPVSSKTNPNTIAATILGGLILGAAGYYAYMTQKQIHAYRAVHV